MGRIRSRASSAHPADRSALSPSKQQPHKRRRKNAYKVVLESVTQKRKKLRLTATFDQQAPPGYTFIGFGNAKLTAQCKEFCRKRGELAYSVSAPPKNNATADPEKISFHVNRLGFYFPNKIVDLAMEWLGIHVNGARPRSKNGSGFTRGLGRRLKQHTNLSEEDQVRAAMRDLFPKMPEDSLEAIVEHAFAEGAKRVGNATNLSLERRVQMAVLAHVRHKHTEYDKLLKEVGYIQARKSVENPCIEKILTWRGENLHEDDDVVEMEDDFREVIVLDSDVSDEQDDGMKSDSESSEEYAPPPATRPSVGNMPRVRLPMANTQDTAAPRPRSLVEPLSSPRLGYERLHERPVSYLTTHHQEAAPSIASPRGLIPVPRPPQAYDPYKRVPYELPYRDRVLQAEVSEFGSNRSWHFKLRILTKFLAHKPYSQQPFVHRRNAGQGPHDEVQAARYAAEPPRGQHDPRHHISGRLPTAEGYRPHVVDRVEYDSRHRGEPRPEDVIPSIERDEPGSAPPTMSNERPRYVSHQERSFMPEPAMHGRTVFPSYRRTQAVDETSRRMPQGNVIDLTDSPGRAPRGFHMDSRQPVTVEPLEAGRMQSSILSIDERYRSRQMEHDASRKVRTVGKNEPTLSYSPNYARRTECRRELEDVSQAGTPVNGSSRLQRPSLTGDLLSNAPVSLRHNADQQIFEQSVPSKRWSGDWMPGQLSGHDDRSSYSVRRRFDEVPSGPGRMVATVDSAGPSQRPRVPVVPERLIANSHARRDHDMALSPTRMRVSHTYDPGTTGIRVQPDRGHEYRAPPRAHYYDYRPANGDAYR